MYLLYFPTTAAPVLPSKSLSTVVLLDVDTAGMLQFMKQHLCKVGIKSE